MEYRGNWESCEPNRTITEDPYGQLRHHDYCTVAFPENIPTNKKTQCGEQKSQKINMGSLVNMMITGYLITKHRNI